MQKFQDIRPWFCYNQHPGKFTCIVHLNIKKSIDLKDCQASLKEHFKVQNSCPTLQIVQGKTKLRF